MPNHKIAEFPDRILARLLAIVQFFKNFFTQKKNQKFDELICESSFEFGSQIDKNLDNQSSDEDDDNGQLSRYNENLKVEKSGNLELLQNFLAEESMQTHYDGARPSEIGLDKHFQQEHLHKNLIRPINYENRSLDHENGGKESFEAKKEDIDKFNQKLVVNPSERKIEEIKQIPENDSPKLDNKKFKIALKTLQSLNKLRIKRITALIKKSPIKAKKFAKKYSLNLKSNKSTSFLAKEIARNKGKPGNGLSL